MKNNNLKATRVSRMACYAALICFTVMSLFPFFVLLINATRAHGQIQRGFSAIPGTFLATNFKNLLSNPNIPVLRALFNSVFVSVAAAALTTYFSTMTAYGMYMYNFKGRNFVFKFILAVMMIPTQVSTLGFLRLLIKIHMIDTLAALYIPSIAAPVVVFYMYQAFQAALPYSIVEASRIDGSNEFYTFNTIVIPMMKPAIAVQAIFSFVSSWNNYFTPALIINSKLKKTIPILIAQLRSADYQKFDMGQVYMIISLAIIPLVIIYLVLSRNIISGVAVGGVKE